VYPVLAVVKLSFVLNYLTNIQIMWIMVHISAVEFNELVEISSVISIIFCVGLGSQIVDSHYLVLFSMQLCKYAILISAKYFIKVHSVVIISSAQLNLFFLILTSEEQGPFLHHITQMRYCSFQC